ncbi:solute carrier family 2, facilitated glucose transporter member 6 [Bombyx mori]
MKSYYFFFREGSKINQILCAVLINLPVFAYGASIGWMSPMTLLLQSPNSPRDPPLTDGEVSWMGAAAYLTCVPADYFMAFLGDRVGRKPALLFVSSVAVLCWVLKLSSMETWALVLARALVGITMAGSYVTCPLYTKEISEDSVRGLLGSVVTLFHCAGNLFLYVVGDVLPYRAVLWLCLALPTLHLVLFMAMPESPSYLIKHGKLDEAVRVVAWLRCRREDDPHVLNEVDLIKNEQERDQESSKFVLKAVVTDRLMSRAFRIALAVALAREVCGAIPVLNFAGEIFTLAAGGARPPLSPNQQAMALGAVQVAGSVLASSIVERAGRKPLLLTTALVSGASMCALATWFLCRRWGAELPASLPVLALCLCIFCDAAGLQPVSVVITGEIFSFKYRGTVMATTMAASSFAAFLQMLFFKPVANVVGLYAAFYFFGGVCLLTALYVVLVVPETKKRRIDEIYEDLKTKKEILEEKKNVIDKKSIQE